MAKQAYICELCLTAYNSMETAEKCEASHGPEKQLKIGFVKYEPFNNIPEVVQILWDDVQFGSTNSYFYKKLNPNG